MRLVVVVCPGDCNVDNSACEGSLADVSASQTATRATGRSTKQLLMIPDTCLET